MGGSAIIAPAGSRATCNRLVGHMLGRSSARSLRSVIAPLIAAIDASTHPCFCNRMRYGIDKNIADSAGLGNLDRSAGFGCPNARFSNAYCPCTPGLSALPSCLPTWLPESLWTSLRRLESNGKRGHGLLWGGDGQSNVGRLPEWRLLLIFFKLFLLDDGRQSFSIGWVAQRHTQLIHQAPVVYPFV